MAAYQSEFLPELGGLHESAYHETASYEADGEYEVPPATAAAAARAALEAVAGEGESEAEGELNPVRRWYPDAMLEHLAHEATEAESEAEAGEAFLPLIPLVAAKLLPLAAKAAPLIAKAMPKVMSAVSKVTPQLTRGVMNVARTMFRAPGGRRLLRTVPTIAQRTVGQIARQVAAGRPVTAQSAARTLARQTAAVLNRPARVRRAVVRSGAFDRHLHQTIPTAPPPGPAPAPGVTGEPGPGSAAGGCQCKCPTCGRAYR